MTTDTPAANPAPVLRREIASARRDILQPVFGNLMRPTDDVLIQQGGGQGLKIYEEIERDPLAYAVLQKRKMALVSREWEVRPGGTRRDDRKAAELAERVLNGEWGLSFDKVCVDLQDALLKGYAVAEIIWDVRDGFYVPVEIKPKDQRRFVFDAEGKLRLLTWENMAEGEELPDRKFVVHRFGDKVGDPYGRGLGHQLFWWLYFKRMVVQFWLVFAEKFGSPTVKGEYDTTMPEAEQDKLLATISNLSQQGALIFPKGTVVELLEAVRSGTVTYPDLVDYCDRMVMLTVLGNTLTTSEGNAGSRALGQVHASVEDTIVDADSDLQSSTHNTQLLSWLTWLNYPDARPPSVWRPRPTEEMAEAKLRQEEVKAASAMLDFINSMRRSGWEPKDPQADIREQWSGEWVYTGQASGVAAPVDVSRAMMLATQEQPPDQVALAAPGNDQAAMRDLVDHLDQAAGGALDALIGRVRAMLDRVDTLEEAQAALVEIYPDLDTSDLALVVGRALALANLTGRADIADDL